MRLINSQTSFKKFKCAVTLLIFLCVFISYIPTPVLANTVLGQTNSNQLLLYTEIKSFNPSASDFTTVVGNDLGSLDNLTEIKPYEEPITTSHLDLQKVTDFKFLDSDRFDPSLFSDDHELRYTTDETAVNSYLQAHPNLVGVTDHKILLPVFEFDTDNNIQAHRDKINTYISNGQLINGSVGQDNVAIIDRSIPLGEYKLDKTLSYDQEHGFYYIYTVRAGVSDISRNLTTFVDSNGNKTEKQGLYDAPTTIGNSILDHKAVEQYVIPEAHDGDGNIVKPNIFVTHTTYYYTLAHTAYVTDTGETLRPTDEGLQNAPATISSYTFNHTVDAGRKKVLDIDTVTNRILSEIKSQDIADVFPESSATHAGQIGIKKLPDSTYEVSLFENGSLTTDLTYNPDGSPRVVDAEGNPVYFSNTFNDIVYTSSQDDTLPIGQYKIEYFLLPMSFDPNTLDSYQHLKINLVIGTKDSNEQTIAANWTHVYVKQPPVTPVTPSSNTPGEPHMTEKKEQLPDTADNSQIVLQGTLISLSAILVLLGYFLKKRLATEEIFS